MTELDPSAAKDNSPELRQALSEGEDMFLKKVRDSMIILRGPGE